MGPIYYDGNGGYWQAADSTNTQANYRTIDGYTAVPMPSPWPASNWSVAPNLTDIGAGVWENGVLADPQ